MKLKYLLELLANGTTFYLYDKNDKECFYGKRSDGQMLKQFGNEIVEDNGIHAINFDRVEIYLKDYVSEEE